MGYATVDVRFFLIDLEPDGCLVAEQLRIRTKNLWNNGRRPQKGADSVLELVLQKKVNFLNMHFFAMGEYFFLTGAF